MARIILTTITSIVFAFCISCSVYAQSQSPPVEDGTLSNGPPDSADPPDDEDDSGNSDALAQQKQAVFERLSAKLATREWVKVYVVLNDPPGLAKNDNAANRAQRRTQVANDHAAFMRKIPPGSAKVILAPDMHPDVTLEVNASGLLHLLKNKRVKVIQEPISGSQSMTSTYSRVNADDAWVDGFTGSGQTIAIIDSGAANNHPMLTGKIVSEWCFSKSDQWTGSNPRTYTRISLCPNGNATQSGSRAAYPNRPVFDPTAIGGNGTTLSLWSQHGSNVAAIAAGKTWTDTSLNRTYRGIARNASIVAINVFHAEGAWTVLGNSTVPYWRFVDSNVQLALRKIRDLKQGSLPSIVSVNLSIGSDTLFSGVCDSLAPNFPEFRDLTNLGVSVFAGTGNEGNSAKIAWPACLSRVAAVGATNKTNPPTVASFSNSSSHIDLLSTGSSMILVEGDVSPVSSSNIDWTGNSGVGPFSGTSFASPAAAGAAAILKEAAPSATTALVKNALAVNGAPVFDSRNNVTKPFLNIQPAIEDVQQATVSLDPEPITVGSTNTGQYGNNYGSDEHPAGIDFTFSLSGTISGMELTLSGYDVDFSDEVSVSVNGFFFLAFSA